MPAGWKEPGAVAPAPSQGAEGGCVPPIPGTARGTFLSLVWSGFCHAAPSNCQTWKTSLELPSVPPAWDPAGPHCRLEVEAGKPGSLSVSKTFQTLLGPLMVRENLNTLLPGWSHSCGKSVAVAPGYRGLLASALRWEEHGVSRQLENQVPTGPAGSPETKHPTRGAPGIPGPGKADTGQRSTDSCCVSTREVP